MPAISTTNSPCQLEQQRRILASQLASVGDLRPGSLGRRYRKCGKANCRCAQPDALGHGPLWSLTWAVRGTTHSRVIPSGPAVERTKAQVAEYHRFQELVRQFIDTSQRLCDAKLQPSVQSSSSTEEKRGSAPRSRRRSSKRSKSS